MKKNSQPKTWLDAFYLLEDYLDSIDNGKKQVVFIDEIQWLDTPKSGFVTALEAFWNSWACFKKNVMLIVCGSSNSWILNKLINNHGGLYNRLTCSIKLSPFDLNNCEKYFNYKKVSLSRYDITQAYMTFGGIPYYFDYFDRTLSFNQNIDNILFAKNAPLKDEFDRLFDSTFNSPTRVKQIIKALFSKNRGLTRQELINLIDIPDGGDLSNILNALITGDFVLKYVSFLNSKKEEYYKLIDPFCLFYLEFLDNTNLNNEFYSTLNIDSQKKVSWNGYAFENVCFNHINQIKKSLGIYGVYSNNCIWCKKGNDDTRGAQIDLIIDRKDNIINMCEIKFYQDVFTVDKNYHFQIIRKMEVLRENIKKKTTSIRPTLITTFGVFPNEYQFDFVNIVTLDDLFKDN